MQSTASPHAFCLHSGLVFIVRDICALREPRGCLCTREGYGKERKAINRSYHYNPIAEVVSTPTVTSRCHHNQCSRSAREAEVGGGACGATLGICRTPEVLHFSYSSIVQLFHRSLSLYLSVYLFICEFAFMSLFICIFFIHGSLSIPPSSSPYRRPFSPMPLSLPPDAFHQPSPRFLKGRETR